MSDTVAYRLHDRFDCFLDISNDKQRTPGKSRGLTKLSGEGNAAL